MQNIVELYQSLSHMQLAALTASAVLIGINKTGIPGIGTLPVVMLALNFDPRLSTGMQLLMLCAGDLIALSFYRKIAPDWKLLARMMPFSVAGILIGSLTLRCVDGDSLRPLIGWIILGLTLLKLAKDRFGGPQALPGSLYVAAPFGILTGFTTQIANAAGPVMAIYLLAMKLPSKEKFMATCIWMFLLTNWIKLPVFIAENRVSREALLLDIPMIAFIVAGAVAGVLFIRRIPGKYYEVLLELIVGASALRLIFA